jgi:hypothetical protein
LILLFSRHAELVSAFLRLKEFLKQIQDDEVISAFFIITLYQYFSLKEPKPLQYVVADCAAAPRVCGGSGLMLCRFYVRRKKIYVLFYG